MNKFSRALVIMFVINFYPSKEKIIFIEWNKWTLSEIDQINSIYAFSINNLWTNFSIMDHCAISSAKTTCTAQHCGLRASQPKEFPYKTTFKWTIIKQQIPDPAAVLCTKLRFDNIPYNDKGY